MCARTEVEAGMNKAHCLSGKTFLVERTFLPCVERESLQGLREQSCRKQMNSSRPKGTESSTRGCAQACSYRARVGQSQHCRAELGLLARGLQQMQSSELTGLCHISAQ